MDESIKPNLVNNTEEKEKLVKRILLAEDDDDLRETFLEILEAGGYTVDAVKDGQFLLEKLFTEKEKYDLIITDNDIPKVKGVEALKKIRENDSFKNLPVIVNSGNIDIEEEVKRLNAFFINKTIKKVDIFLELVKKALSISQE
ncbi:MAG: response regulator [Patescibacteria group bacterium]